MTLIVAERKNGIVTFASDSRITLGEAGFFDQGVKLFNIPVKISGPTKSIEEIGKPEFELKYGMAVAGSSLASFSIKDSLSEILGNIQYATNMSDLSIIGIGTFVFDKYSEISAKLAQVMREAALSEILLGGFCIHQGRTRILRFYPDVTAEAVVYHWEEILLEDGLYFCGSGKRNAEKFFEQTPGLTPLQIIKSVINSADNKTVGGYVQFGMFYPQDFKLSGVREEVLDEDSDKKITITHFLGFDLDKQDSSKYPRLFIPHSIVTPEWRHPKMMAETH